MKPTYEQRNVLLLKLGFKSYEDYLNSYLWRDIRAEVLDRDNHECKLCGVKSFTVHHLDYKKETLLGGSLLGLVTICQNCHSRIEFNRDGQKRSLSSAKSTYNRLRSLPKTVIRHQNRPKKPRRKGGRLL